MEWTAFGWYGADLSARVPSITPVTWAAWLGLARQWGERGHEVSGILCRDVSEVAPGAPVESAPWAILIPTQRVSPTRCEWDALDPAHRWTDLVTGETYTSLPPHLVHAGSIHSHHRMAAFFSVTDIHDEKDVVGIHIVTGDMDSGWEAKADAVTPDGQRHKGAGVPILPRREDWYDTEPHRNVAERVSVAPPKPIAVAVAMPSIVGDLLDFARSRGFTPVEATDADQDLIDELTEALMDRPTNIRLRETIREAILDALCDASDGPDTWIGDIDNLLLGGE